MSDEEDNDNGSDNEQQAGMTEEEWKKKREEEKEKRLETIEKNKGENKRQFYSLYASPSKQHYSFPKTERFKTAKKETDKEEEGIQNPYTFIHRR